MRASNITLEPPLSITTRVTLTMGNMHIGVATVNEIDKSGNTNPKKESFVSAVML